VVTTALRLFLEHRIEKKGKMNVFKTVLLWISTSMLCFALYSFGQSTYYCYKNNDDVAFTSKGYRGKTTVKMWNLYDREQCSYVGTIKVFDKQPKVRTVCILIILGLSTFSAFRINRSGKREKDPFHTVPSFNQS